MLPYYTDMNADTFSYNLLKTEMEMVAKKITESCKLSLCFISFDFIIWHSTELSTNTFDAVVGSLNSLQITVTIIA